MKEKTDLIRSTVDAIDAEHEAALTLNTAQTLEIDRLNGVVAEKDARIAELEDLLGGGGEEPVEITMVQAPSIPLDVAPVARQPFEAQEGIWEGGGGVEKVVHNWFVGGGNFISAMHDNPFFPSAGPDGQSGHIGGVLEYQEVVTFLNGEVRKFKTPQSLPVLPPVSGEPEPTPDPTPDPTPLPEPIPTDGTVRTDVWFLPEATGDGSGSSPENAKAITALESSIAPGKHLTLLADGRVWPAFSKTINKGGASGAPCIIQGVGLDNKLAFVTLKGGRPSLNHNYDESWPRSQQSGGADCFTLQRGADWLTVRSLEFLNCGEVFKVMGSIQGLTWDWLRFLNVKEFLWMESDSEPSGTGHWGAGQKRSLVDFAASRLHGRGFELGMRLMGSTRRVKVEGFDMDSMRVLGHISFFAQMGKGGTTDTGWRDDDVNNVHFIGEMHGFNGVVKNLHDQKFLKPWYYENADGTKHNLYAPVDSDGFREINNSRTIKSQDVGSTYWNGDVFSAERMTHDLTFEKITASGCCDSFADIKAQSSKFIQCTAINNKRNWRLWGDNAVHQLIDCESINPRKHVFNLPGGGTRQLGGSGSSAHVFVTGSDVEGGPGPRIIVQGMTFQGGPSAVFHINKASPHSVKFEPSNCVLEPGMTLTPAVVG